MKTYKIVRMIFDSEDKPIIKTGLTLKQAQSHCNDDDTHGKGWFDCYREENPESAAPGICQALSHFYLGRR